MDPDKIIKCLRQDLRHGSVVGGDPKRAGRALSGGLSVLGRGNQVIVPPRNGIGIGKIQRRGELCLKMIDQFAATNSALRITL